MNLDEQLFIQESRWRGRLITLGVLAALGLVAGILVYAFLFRSEGTKARPTEDLKVGRATINANLIISGKADAQLISDLSFRTSGRVESVDVKVGDPVHQGDLLASLESADLANSVASAQANLALAQARLTALLEGATDAELAAADQSVQSGQAGVNRADRDLQKLLQGPQQPELTADQQAVVTAETALNQAQRDKTRLLEGPTQAEVASAQQVVTSAETALAQAQRDRTRLLQGPTQAELAAAQQAVVTAQTTLNEAQRARDDLYQGPTAAQLAAAEQTVAAANANLASAQASLARLTAPPSDAQLASAQSAVAAAQQGLNSAQNGLDNARSNVNSTEAAVRAARTAYCLAAPSDPLCGSVDLPLPSSTVNDLLTKLSDSSTTPSLLSPINSLIQTNTGYVVALNSVDTASGSVSTAQAQLASAQAALTALRAGPSDTDIAAAQAAVTAAQQNRDLAQLNLDNLRAGPRADDLANADDAVRSAQAALDAAIARRSDVEDGADAAEIARADDNVRSTQAVLDAATARRDDLVAPPSADDLARADDAVRSAEAALAAAQAKQADLLDAPKTSDVASAQDAKHSAQAVLAAAIAGRDETKRGPRESRIDQERQAVRVAQLAVAAAQIRVRDAQISAPFDGTVAAINLKPGEFTGVGSATPAIVLLTPDAIVLKMNLGETDYPNVKLDQRGIVVFDALPGKPYPFTVLELGLSPTVTQGVVTYEVTGALVVPPDSPRPAPGMSASGQIITDSRPNVIAIPPRAIRRRGADQVVDVRRNGAVEEQVVSTGLSDTNNVEVLSGLSEGDVVVVPLLVSGSSSKPQKEPTLPSGIR
jgi:HlyD family secretion protein